MGRNKIKIERIESERKRTATYTKRSHGLIKKAMELSILCDCEVSLFIFANDKLVVYSSKDVKDTLIKFVEFKSNYFSYSNADYPAICHSTSIPEDLSEQRAVGATPGINDSSVIQKDQTTMAEKAIPQNSRQMLSGQIPSPGGVQQQQHVSMAPDYFTDQDRRSSYMYDQQRSLGGGADMIPPDFSHSQDPSYGYPSVYRNPTYQAPLSQYPQPQSQPPYKPTDQSKFKTVSEVNKRPDNIQDDNLQIAPKKPPEA
ncbi:myocyte-specific enhancer factor 2A, putative [Entamoeba histolytica HM-3:IMSS]|nr:myocyte-specific enhancer factor 2A, putative [Entamoeba histolytica HM-3:IMSS]